MATFWWIARNFASFSLLYLLSASIADTSSRSSLPRSMSCSSCRRGAAIPWDPPPVIYSPRFALYSTGNGTGNSPHLPMAQFPTFELTRISGAANSYIGGPVLGFHHATWGNLWERQSNVYNDDVAMWEELLPPRLLLCFLFTLEGLYH